MKKLFLGLLLMSYSNFAYAIDRDLYKDDFTKEEYDGNWIFETSLTLEEQASDPLAPETGHLKLYVKDDSGDLKFYTIDPDSNVSEIGSGGGGGGSGDVTSVGDCTNGPCLDGTSDGGTQISLYDRNSHAMTITPENLTAARNWIFTDNSDVVVGTTNTVTMTNKTMTAADNTIGADTAVALAANGSNCSAGSGALGVDASGASESCTDFEEDLSNSAGLAAALSDENGTGTAVFSDNATMTTLTATTVNTGQGANELYDMDQNVDTGASPTFAGLTLGSPLALSSGGLGTSLSDPNADRIPFWDDSAGQVEWLSANISGTTLVSSGWQDDGATVSTVTSTDLVGIGTSLATGKLHIVNDADRDALKIVGNGTQSTGYLANILASDLTPRMRLSGAGVLTLYGTGTYSVLGFTGASEVTTATVAETAFDTNVFGSSKGSYQFHDGTATVSTVAVLNTVPCSNGQAPIFSTSTAWSCATPSTLTVADSTDASSFVGIYDSASGPLDPKTDGGLLYNASTANLQVGGQMTVTGTGAQSTITEGLVVNNGSGTDADDSFKALGSAGNILFQVLPARNAVNMTPLAATPSTQTVGDLYVDSTPTPDELCFFDGANWQGISSGTDANCV